MPQQFQVEDSSGYQYMCVYLMKKSACMAWMMPELGGCPWQHGRAMDSWSVCSVNDSVNNWTYV